MTYPKFGAALFDLDGTLIDTRSPHVEAERAAVRSFGIADLAEDHPDTFGHGVRKGAQMVVSHYGIEDDRAYFDRYLGHWDRMVEGGIELLPGAEESVRSITASGIRTALVTSGERSFTDGFLKISGLGEVFSASVTIEEVVNSKPHPEPYLTAAKMLEVSPARCIVFEDSITGFRAARAAGMTCIGIGDIALSAEGDDAPDMAIRSFVGFDITSVRPF